MNVIKTITKFMIRGIAGAVVDSLVLWFLSTYFLHNYFAKYILAPSIECITKGIFLDAFPPIIQQLWFLLLLRWYC